MSPALLQLAQVGLVAAINALMANGQANQIIRNMVMNGRTKLTEDEERELNRESNDIHEAHLEAIRRAQAEGR